MIDYNDGNWHGWNGGECPVHPETEVEAIFGDGSGSGNAVPADCYSWDRWHPIAFRVVKPYREPREFWMHQQSQVAYDSEESAIRNNYKGHDIIHVREVIE